MVAFCFKPIHEKLFNYFKTLYLKNKKKCFQGITYVITMTLFFFKIVSLCVCQAVLTLLMHSSSLLLAFSVLKKIWHNRFPQ